MEYLPLYIVISLISLFVFISLVRSIRIVPAQKALVVERLGKFHKTLGDGLHILVPFIDQVRYHHSLKEVAMDVPAQACITRDNVKVEVDGVLYIKVIDPKKASYGIDRYQYASVQLVQTTMRSAIGKLDLDKTFEERDNINAEIVKGVDEATETWGIKVTRYEIKNIDIPKKIVKAMEAQLKAERERRAVIARSEGEMQSKINYSLGMMEEAVNKSIGEKEKRINEAEGRAKEIEAIAKATASGIYKIAESIQMDGGEEAVVLRIAESYLTELRKLAREDTHLILPLNLGDIQSVMTMVRRALQEQ